MFHDTPCQIPRKINEKDLLWTVKKNTQLRFYGVFLHLYTWCIWCCDHYRLDLCISIAVIFTGALILWFIYPNSESKSLLKIVSTAASDLKQGQIQNHQHQKQKQQYQHHLQEQEQGQEQEPDQESTVESLLVTTAPVTSKSSAIWSPGPASAISTASLNTPPTAAVLALIQESAQVAAIDNSNLDNSRPMCLEDEGMELLAKDPPPPYYYKNKSVEYSKSVSSELCYHQQSHWRYLWLNFVVNVLGACGWMLCIGLWDSKFSMEIWGLTWNWSMSDCSTSLKMLISSGAVGLYGILVYVALLRLCNPSTTTKARTIAIAPGSNVDANDKKRLIITESSLSLMSEEKESRHHLDVEPNQPEKWNTRDMDVRLKGNTGNIILGINSCQGKVNNVLSRSRNVIVVRKRNLASSSLPIATSSSSLISTAIQQIKCELFVLASLVVPRHRPWGLSEEKLCDIRIGTSQDIERSENEYGIIHNNELNDITCNSALGSRNTLQQENFGLLLNGVIARTSSQASGSALLRFTRMALDPERLGSVIQFYRQKHVAAMAEVKSDPNCARQEQDEFAFVVRSSRLPIVRVGLYGATQKRLWTSAGSIDITGELSKDTIDG